MGLTEILKKALGDEQYGKVGKGLQQEISKEFIPKDDFNKANESKKDFEKKLGEESKKVTQLTGDLEIANKLVQEKEDATKTDFEKLQDQITGLNDQLKTQTDAGTKLKTELDRKEREVELTSLFRLSDVDVNPKYDKYVLGLLGDVKVEDAKAELVKLAQSNKEVFGVTKIKSPQPKGKFDEGNKELFTREEVDSMSQNEITNNYDKVIKSQKLWD